MSEGYPSNVSRDDMKLQAGTTNFVRTDDGNPIQASVTPEWSELNNTLQKSLKDAEQVRANIEGTFSSHSACFNIKADGNHKMAVTDNTKSPESKVKENNDSTATQLANELAAPLGNFLSKRDLEECINAAKSGGLPTMAPNAMDDLPMGADAHMKEGSSPKKVEYPKSKPDADMGPVKCPDCDKVYSSYKHMQRHQRTHSEIRPYACQNCNKGFYDLNKLKRHRLTHSGVKPYECHICEQKVSRPEHLRRHLLTHSEVKPYQCGLCDFTARRHDSVRSHIKSKHPDIQVEVFQMPLFTKELEELKSSARIPTEEEIELMSPPPPVEKKKKKSHHKKKEKKQEGIQLPNLAIQTQQTEPQVEYLNLTQQVTISGYQENQIVTQKSPNPVKGSRKRKSTVPTPSESLPQSSEQSEAIDTSKNSGNQMPQNMSSKTDASSVPQNTFNNSSPRNSGPVPQDLYRHVTPGSAYPAIQNPPGGLTEADIRATAEQAMRASGMLPSPSVFLPAQHMAAIPAAFAYTQHPGLALDASVSASSAAVVKAEPNTATSNCAFPHGPIPVGPPLMAMGQPGFPRPGLPAQMPLSPYFNTGSDTQAPPQLSGSRNRRP